MTITGCACDIMTAGRALYLRIPVSAFTAESRALNSAGGCHIRRIWYNKSIQKN
ncbi:hypothetical protein CLOM621_07637 [Clostridium sp. M62/1]|nr:hypothetical protein CLOM621_07637 [Clostridium sp. M62/1]